MKKLFLILLYLCSGACMGQISESDFLGKWLACGSDDSLFHSTVISLKRSDSILVKNCCKEKRCYSEWHFEKKENKIMFFTYGGSKLLATTNSDSGTWIYNEDKRAIVITKGAIGYLFRVSFINKNTLKLERGNK